MNGKESLRIAWLATTLISFLNSSIVDSTIATSLWEMELQL